MQYTTSSPCAAASGGSQVLRGEFLSMTEGATFTLGQPVTVDVKVADECGNLLLGQQREEGGVARRACDRIADGLVLEIGCRFDR